MPFQKKYFLLLSVSGNEGSVQCVGLVFAIWVVAEGQEEWIWAVRKNIIGRENLRGAESDTKISFTTEEKNIRLISAFGSKWNRE